MGQIKERRIKNVWYAILVMQGPYYPAHIFLSMFLTLGPLKNYLHLCVKFVCLAMEIKYQLVMKKKLH